MVNDNPCNKWLFTGEFGIHVSVSNTTMMAVLLKQCAIGPGSKRPRTSGGPVVLACDS